MPWTISAIWAIWGSNSPRVEGLVSIRQATS